MAFIVPVFLALSLCTDFGQLYLHSFTRGFTYIYIYILCIHTDIYIYIYTYIYIYNVYIYIHAHEAPQAGSTRSASRLAGGSKAWREIMIIIIIIIITVIVRIL